MLYWPFTGPVTAGCGLTADQEDRGLATLVEETRVNKPAFAFQEMTRLDPDRMADIVTAGDARGAGCEMTV